MEDLLEDKPWMISPSTGKREADMLLKWLNLTLDKLGASEQPNARKLFRKSSKIFNTCLGEVIRQVAT
jgi:hypothetical protein